MTIFNNLSPRRWTRFWRNIGSSIPEVKVLTLFHRCAAEVPAYRRFLEARGVNPAEITSFSAFQELPLMGKADYMQAYPLPQRCFGGSLRGSNRVAVSSDSTGQPTFWPRSVAHELDVTR